MRIGPALWGVLLVLAAASPVSAQDSGAASEPSRLDQEKESRVKVHGFLLGALSRRTTGAQPARGSSGDPVLEEGRVRLDISGASGSAETFFLAKGDLLYDAVVKGSDVDLREAYAGHAKEALDFRLGRQIITWGVGDLFFINDVFPKDWESFFSGRPMEYLKLGVDALRGRYSSGVVNVDFVAVPFFTQDALPSAERFVFPDPLSTVPTQQEVTPPARFSNTELALRLYRQLGGFDASLYAYRGYWRSPGVRLDDPVSPAIATFFFPTLSVFGASGQRNVSGGILSLEAGYYDSRQDPRGEDPGIPNSQWRLLAGYQRQAWEDFTIGVQGYAEAMEHYGAYLGSLPAGRARQDRIRAVVSIRLTQWLDYQTWKLSLFAAYSPTDEDYFLQPEVFHKVTDSFGASLGANVFGGRTDTTFFGQFEESDNVYALARFDF